MKGKVEAEEEEEEVGERLDGPPWKSMTTVRVGLGLALGLG